MMLHADNNIMSLLPLVDCHSLLIMHNLPHFLFDGCRLLKLFSKNLVPMLRRSCCFIKRYTRDSNADNGNE